MTTGPGSKKPKSLDQYNPSVLGRAGLNRNQAYMAALAALRAGENPEFLCAEFGEWAVREAQETYSSGTADLQDLRVEVVHSLRREMHCAPRANTRVSAGSHLLKAMVSYDLKKMERDKQLRDPETRQEAARELRDIPDDLYELMLDVWMREHPRAPRVEQLITEIIGSPSWASVMHEAGWVRR